MVELQLSGLLDFREVSSNGNEGETILVVVSTMGASSLMSHSADSLVQLIPFYDGS